MYASASKTPSSDGLIDLRSDTVTRPSQGMREAMAHATVGDDVYGDDPTVAELEAFAADLLGKEAGLFVTSGTQSNLTALMTHCGRGDEYIGGNDYHIGKYEAGGAAVLGGISPHHLTPGADGGLDPNHVAKAVRPDDVHFAVSKLVCLENTYNGRVVPQDNIETVAEIARANGLALHLDGARLMNAVVKSNRKPSELVASFDTVSLCLSKGLGAPIGSVLTGPRDFIEKAKRARKMLGGGLRQAGVLAACGLYALRNNVNRLAQDHAHARMLAERVNALDGFSIDLDTVQTNMIWMSVPAPSNDDRAVDGFSNFMRARGLITADPSGSDRTVRLVTHLDIAEQDLPTIVDAFEAWAEQSAKAA
ncbi:MAG: low-specificity L-threonine aldolase [Pseudomonadota bacterium]